MILIFVTLIRLGTVEMIKVPSNFLTAGYGRSRQSNSIFIIFASLSLIRILSYAKVTFVEMRRKPFLK